MTADHVVWIQGHTFRILFGLFTISIGVLQTLILFRINIFKPIVIIGTFALAMAFAANDLVNFIGVPLAGLHAFRTASASGDPVNTTMGALGASVKSETVFLAISGLIMVTTLWFSKKAQTVTKTEISLGRQDEGVERFESMAFSRLIVKMFIGLYETARSLVPHTMLRFMSMRMRPPVNDEYAATDTIPSFDLLRASVNLMVAGAVISFATSYKLPLSTTYVTFMVAMGSSFADRAWGRDSAVYRITGVITVIGGWFLTAFMAFTVTSVFASFIYFAGVPAVALLIALAVYNIVRNHKRHVLADEADKKDKVFNLKKVREVSEIIPATFIHMSYLIREIRESLDASLDALFKEQGFRLKEERRKSRKIQRWANVIIANIFKALRLIQHQRGRKSARYPQTIRRIQKLVDGHRDIVARSYKHVTNQHKGLLPEQIRELQEVKQLICKILHDVEQMFRESSHAGHDTIHALNADLRNLAEKLNRHQMERIADGSSKTRLTILYYAIVGNTMMMAKQTLKLLTIFEESFGAFNFDDEFDLD